MSSLALSAVKASNTLSIYQRDQVLFLFSDSPDQKLLPHRWHLCLGCGNECVTSFYTY